MEHKKLYSWQSVSVNGRRASPRHGTKLYLACFLDLTKLGGSTLCLIVNTIEIKELRSALCSFTLKIGASI